MNSVRDARSSDGESQGDGLKRIRRRGQRAMTIGVCGYIATFVVDIVRNSPSDDQVVNGVERAFGFVALAGFFVVFVLWVLTESTDYAQRIWNLRDRAQAASEGIAGPDGYGASGSNAVPITSARSHRNRSVS